MIPFPALAGLLVPVSQAVATYEVTSAFGRLHGCQRTIVAEANAMATTSSPHIRSVLGAALDIFRVRTPTRAGREAMLTSLRQHALPSAA
jgi:hypothetical protein